MPAEAQPETPTFKMVPVADILGPAHKTGPTCW